MPAAHRVSIRLDDTERADLETAAREAGATVSAVVRRSLRTTGVLTAAAPRTEWRPRS